jgi:hypothetical protein
MLPFLPASPPAAFVGVEPTGLAAGLDLFASANAALLVSANDPWDFIFTVVAAFALMKSLFDMCDLSVGSCGPALTAVPSRSITPGCGCTSSTNFTVALLTIVV